MYAPASPRSKGLASRLLSLIGFGTHDKPDLCIRPEHREAELDHPATRRALAGLPPHLLRDIGVSIASPGRGNGDEAEGAALRKYLW